MNANCFVLEDNGTVRRWLRRYRSVDPDDKLCPVNRYHNGMGLIGDGPSEPHNGMAATLGDVSTYKDDPRWPVKCDHCDYHFTPEDQWQVFGKCLYRRVDTGEVMSIKEAPAGALWRATYQEDCASLVGADGQCWMCKLPGGHEWMIDSRANNCDSPCKHCGRPFHVHAQENWEQQKVNCPNHYEDSRPHKCWVREGVAPNFTVGKNGITCGAGAGSILVPEWHGFLRNGRLEQC